MKGCTGGLIRFQMLNLLNFKYYEKLKEAITGINRKSATDKLLEILENQNIKVF